MIEFILRSKYLILNSLDKEFMLTHVCEKIVI